VSVVASSNAQSSSPEYHVAEIQIGDSAPRKFWFRGGTTDQVVMNEIFGATQYGLGRLRRAREIKSFQERQIATNKVPLIIDAGANIGATSVFYALAVPNAQVVAIEPDAGNFELLQRNIYGLNVEAIHDAVSSTPGLARVTDPGIGHWGYRTENISSGSDTGTTKSVPRLTMNDIYQRYSARCFPFVVKVDIEGGEEDLFSGSTEWVSVTPVLIVELHDWLLTKSASSRKFLQCVSQLDRDFVYIGEDVFSISNAI
jgi:FkbM family methyltransferase